MPPPRLRPNSFFVLLKTEEIADGFGAPLIPKLLLTGRRLHSEFFHCSEEKPLHLNAKPHGLSIGKGWRTSTWMEEVEFQCAMDGLVALLRLTAFEEIRVNLLKRTVSFGMLADFVRLCDALQDNRSLERIFLRADWPKRLLNRGLVEFLPDSITRVDSDPEICPLLHRRSIVLEQLNLFVQHTDFNFALVFRTKARTIEFFPDYWFGLEDLSDHGPFYPNEHVEKVIISAGLVDEEEVGPHTWELMVLPRCCRALRWLSQVNKKLEVEIKPNGPLKLLQTEDVNEAIRELEEILDNARRLVNCAQEFAVRIASIRLLVRTNLDTGNAADNVRFGRHFKLTRGQTAGRSCVRSFQHAETRIDLEVRFKRNIGI
ncbi:hypothetical protein M3Y99_01502900 [Aphelenchoides fujianensis]|nr:hypothetical protein M3Y99_01502900 [Aphelenchoides fujianensis]